MSLCFFTPIFPPQYSGATFQALTLARELAQKGESIFFITLRDQLLGSSSPLFLSEQYENFEVIVVPVKGMKNIINGTCSISLHMYILLKLAVVLLVQRKRYSIVHCHNLAFPFTGVGFIARILGKKSVGKVTMADDFEFEKIGRITGKINKFFLLCFDRIVSISNDISCAFKEKRLPQDKIVYIPNSINTTLFTPVPSIVKLRLRASLEINGGFVAVFVGGVTYRKGVDTLIKLWVDFARKHDDVMLNLVGPKSAKEGALGDEYCVEHVEKALHQNSLEHRIFLTGRVQNVNEYLQLSDLFVFPSTMEGMPNVVLEAMACGLPVVSFRVSGIDDIISPGCNGEVVDQGDVTGFSHAIEKIYLDSVLREKYSDNAVKSIGTRFSVQEIALKYQQLYSTI